MVRVHEGAKAVLIEKGLSKKRFPQKPFGDSPQGDAQYKDREKKNEFFNRLPCFEAFDT